MLVAHSRILIPPETWFILSLVHRFPLDQELTAKELEQAIEIMTRHYRWPDMNLPADDLRAEMACVDEPHLIDLIEVVYGAHLRASGKVRWGDKTPPYIQILPELAALFPGSKFIYLVRDGRDVAKSFQHLRMYGPWLHDNTVEWRDASHWARKWMRSQYADHILQVRYEDLVIDAEGTLRRICTFLGEEFESQMLSWHEKVGRMVPTRELHVHRKLQRDVRREDIDRWKREMTARELFVAEAFMYRHLDRYGYLRRYRGSVWIPMFWLARLYCVVLWPSIPLRILRRIISVVRRKHGSDRGVLKKSKDSTQSNSSKVLIEVPRAVSWRTRSWRGFVR